MKAIETIVYDFRELSKEAKQIAIDKWYEHEDYPMLNDNLFDNFCELATLHGVEYENIKLYYSLSHSQGDGLCFVGILRKNGIDLYLTHTSRYYYAKSVSMEFIQHLPDESIEVAVDDNEDASNLFDIYISICNALEKIGYAEINYRMNEEEFNELCESNEWTFLPSGIMKNY